MSRSRVLASIILSLAAQSASAQVCEDLFKTLPPGVQQTRSNAQGTQPSRLQNLFDKMRGLLGSRSSSPASTQAPAAENAPRPSLSQPNVFVPTTPEEKVAALAKEIGFEYNPDLLEEMHQALRDYVATQSLYNLSVELGGRNGLTGKPRNPDAGKDILDKNISEKEKRAEFLARYEQRMNTGNDDILQIIRGMNGLEQKYGWGALWTAMRQNRFLKATSPDDVQYYSSFDGLVYRPAANGFLTVGWNGYFHSEDSSTFPSRILEMINKANSGRPVIVTNIKIFETPRDRGSNGTWLSFTADVKAYNTGDEIPAGARLLSGLTEVPPLSGLMIIQPIQIDRDELSLARTSPGVWTLRFKTGLNFRQRVGRETTLNYTDIKNAIEAAALDLGFRPSAFHHEGKEDSPDRKITFTASPASSLAPSAIADLEKALVLRIKELRDPIAARRSQQSPIKPGANEDWARYFEKSGFTSADELERYLGFDSSRQGSTDFEGAPWHATYPVLSFHDGVARVTIDDRIYGEGYLNFREAAAFAEAKRMPMSSIRTSTGVWVVYVGARSAPYWSGYIEEYRIFKTFEATTNYRATHRFALSE